MPLAGAGEQDTSQGFENTNVLVLRSPSKNPLKVRASSSRGSVCAETPQPGDPTLQAWPQHRWGLSSSLTPTDWTFALQATKTHSAGSAARESRFTVWHLIKPYFRVWGGVVYIIYFFCLKQAPGCGFFSFWLTKQNRVQLISPL